VQDATSQDEDFEGVREESAAKLCGTITAQIARTRLIALNSV
jgi:hypothetical protein